MDVSAGGCAVVTANCEAATRPSCPRHRSAQCPPMCCLDWLCALLTHLTHSRTHTHTLSLTHTHTHSLSPSPSHAHSCIPYTTTWPSRGSRQSQHRTTSRLATVWACLSTAGSACIPPPHPGQNPPTCIARLPACPPVCPTCTASANHAPKRVLLHPPPLDCQRRLRSMRHMHIP